MGNTCPIDRRPQNEVQVGPDKLPFATWVTCFLLVKTAWKKFRKLLPVLTSRHLSYKTRDHVYSSCVRSATLHASETWPLTKTNLQCLQRKDRAMFRQICSIKPEDVATVGKANYWQSLRTPTSLAHQSQRLRVSL